jgi:hypothetical protein
MIPPTSPKQKSNRTAVAWALIGQSIWIPAFVLNSQDQLADNNQDYDFTNTVKLPYQELAILNRANLLSVPITENGTVISQIRSTKSLTGIVLNTVGSRSRQLTSIRPDSPFPISSQYATFFAPPPPPSSPRPNETALLIKPNLNQKDQSHRVDSPESQNPLNIIKRLYNRADLLGGALTLKDLNEPEMPPIARAERAQWSRSGDPLAPIPQAWRESMRKALHGLTFKSGQEPKLDGKIPSESLRIDTARIVHVPSRRVKQSTDVPLAIQSDGSVDILNRPDDPAVLEEIKSWSASQQPPSSGRMTPAVVHLHPLPPGESSSLYTGQSSTKVYLRSDQNSQAATRAKVTAPSLPTGSSEPSGAQVRTSSPSPEIPQAAEHPPVDVGSNPPPSLQSVDVGHASAISNSEAKQ